MYNLLYLTFVLMASFLTKFSHSFMFKNKSLGKIKSSALVTITLCLIINILGFKLTNTEIHHLELLILGGTFVGMADHQKFSIVELLGISIVFYLSYELISPSLSGPHTPGGILGFFAFASSLFMTGLYYVVYQMLKKPIDKF